MVSTLNRKALYTDHTTSLLYRQIHYLHDYTISYCTKCRQQPAEWFNKLWIWHNLERWRL